MHDSPKYEIEREKALDEAAAKFARAFAEASELLGPAHLDSVTSSPAAAWDHDLIRYAAWVDGGAWTYVGLFDRSGPFDWSVGIEVGRLVDFG
ncbi:MAG: hypothetical protein AB7S26_34105 [Sandaracinaceae bacterium]